MATTPDTTTPAATTEHPLDGFLHHVQRAMAQAKRGILTMDEVEMAVVLAGIALATAMGTP